MAHAAKLQFDIELLRRGGNQLGVIAMAAGLVALFIDPILGHGEVKLAAVGFVVYITSSVGFKSKTNDGQSPGG